MPSDPEANNAKQIKRLGHLVMASTHIGCLADIPPRTLQALRDADLVVFEEDKPGRALLKAAGIRKDYLRYSEHNQEESLKTIKKSLKSGSLVVYCSDQGSPTLADPGRHILAVAYDLKAKVTPIPGPSSVTAAISACPLDLSRFYFAGFPPRVTEERGRWLARLDQMPSAIILMDAPYRLHSLVEACSQHMRETRQVFLAANISLEDETYILAKNFADLRRKIENLGKMNFILICSAD